MDTTRPQDIHADWGVTRPRRPRLYAPPCMEVSMAGRRRPEIPLARIPIQAAMGIIADRTLSRLDVLDGLAGPEAAAALRAQLPIRHRRRPSLRRRALGVVWFLVRIGFLIPAAILGLAVIAYFALGGHA